MISNAHATISTASDPQLVRSFRGHEQTIQTLAFSSDLYIFLSFSSKELKYLSKLIENN